jgi:hypothetical protein
VKALLGREFLTVGDLTTLLRTEECRDCRCYLEIAAAEEYECGDPGLYTGSTVHGETGISRRISEQKRKERCQQDGNLDARLRNKHYNFTGKPSIISRFFLLAQVPQSHPARTPYSRLLEAIFPAYLNFVGIARTNAR